MSNEVSTLSEQDQKDLEVAIVGGGVLIVYLIICVALIFYWCMTRKPNQQIDNPVIREFRQTEIELN